MNIRPLSSAIGAVTIAALAACSSAPPRHDPYANAGPAPVYAQPQPYNQATPYAAYGVVRSIDVIPMQARTTGGGAVLGAVLGAVVGNQIGSGGGRAAATVVGAVGGGVAGNAIERRTRRDDEVFRVSVHFDDGNYRDFDFQRVDDLRPGDRVKWENGQLQRM